VLQAFEYDAYGARYAYDGSGASIAMSAIDGAGVYGYQGRRLDAETGFYYFRNRYLNVGLGRFLTMDPIGRWGDEKELGNPIGFLGNRGISRRDFLGLTCQGGGGETEGGLRGPLSFRLPLTELPGGKGRGKVYCGSCHDPVYVNPPLPPIVSGPILVGPQGPQGPQGGAPGKKDKSQSWWEKFILDWVYAQYGGLDAGNAVADTIGEGISRSWLVFKRWSAWEIDSIKQLLWWFSEKFGTCNAVAAIAFSGCVAANGCNSLPPYMKAPCLLRCSMRGAAAWAICIITSKKK